MLVYTLAKQPCHPDAPNALTELMALDFAISGDPGEMFIPAGGEDPGFSGSIAFDIDLPLEGSGGILTTGY